MVHAVKFQFNFNSLTKASLVSLLTMVVHSTVTKNEIPATN